MAHTVTGKLNKAATQFQAGESTGFGIRIGEKHYNRESGQSEWTNYKAAVFAKNPNQIAFYQSALVEGAIVSVSGESIKIDRYQGQNGEILTLEINGARIEFVESPQPQQQPQAPQGYAQPQAPQHPQQPPMQQRPASPPGYQPPKQGNAAYQQNGFPDDEIPFG